MRVRPKNDDLVLARLSYYGSPLSPAKLKRWRERDPEPLPENRIMVGGDWDERNMRTHGRIGITRGGRLHAKQVLYPGDAHVVWQDRNDTCLHYLNQSITIIPRPSE